jgi:hypothetical protein
MPKKKPMESSALFLAQERTKAMEANDTFTKKYGLVVRPATPEELNQDNTHPTAGFGSRDLQDSEARHNRLRLVRGLKEIQKETN